MDACQDIPVGSHLQDVETQAWTVVTVFAALLHHHTEETKIGKMISVVSHPFLLDNYEVYVRRKWDCGWFLLFLNCFSLETGAENLNLGSL